RTSLASRRTVRSPSRGRANQGCQPSPAGPGLLYSPTSSSRSSLEEPIRSVCRARPPNGHLRPRMSHAIVTAVAVRSTTSHGLSKPSPWIAAGGRSEEHTSELQSPYDLVCRLLLEKKNKQHKQ